MRNSYLVCYDISDDKRLRRVFKIMRGWGDHLQLSVFECQLTRMDLARLKSELAEVIHHTTVSRAQLKAKAAHGYSTPPPAGWLAAIHPGSPSGPTGPGSP